MRFLLRRSKLPAVFAAVCAAAVCLRADGPATATSPLEIPPIYADVASRFSVAFPGEHLSADPPGSPAISAAAWTNYLGALDFERVYFLASDIEALRERAPGLGAELSGGGMDFAFSVYELFKERVQDRATFVEALLKEGFDLDADETYRWKRRKLPWPASDLERDAIWRLKIKNEYVQQIVSRENGETPGEDDGIVEEEDEEPAPDPGQGEGGGDAADVNGDGGEPAAPRPVPTPEEFIAKRYRQFLSTLKDNDAEWVLQTYLTAFAQAYDPHSAYMSPSANEDFDIEMNLSLVGIGALLRSDEGAARIVSLIPGGPAQRDTRDVRLRPGDKIVAVGQHDEPMEDILHWPLYRVVRLIRGKKGTTVSMLVIPASDPSGAKTKVVDLVRDEVKLEEQAAKLELRDVETAKGGTRKLAVIRVPTFYAGMQAKPFLSEDDQRRVSADVQAHLERVLAEKAEGVLLDLRGNGGGSLLEAIRMTGLFIAAGPVVQVQEPRRMRILPDMDPAVAYAGPLVVLVNRLSASASEIVAAALQDYDRAIVVGDRCTHGKGTVQTIVPLGRDKQLGSIKATCSMFFRISGDSTQKRGVIPDVSIPSSLDYMELGEESLPNAMEWSRIRPAVFRPLSPGVARWVDALRDGSAERRENNPRFMAYMQLVDRLRVLNESQVVPLGIERRRALAREEKKLRDLQQEVDPEDATAPENGRKRPDLVLDEALRILSDLAAMEDAADVKSQTTRSDASGVADQIAEWLRGTP